MGIHVYAKGNFVAQTYTHIQTEQETGVMTIGKICKADFHNNQ